MATWWQRAIDGAGKGSIGGFWGALGGAVDGALNGPLYRTTVKKGSSSKFKSSKSSKSSKGKSVSKSKSSKGEAGMYRSVLQEGRDALTLLKEAYPQLVELYGQYGPQMAKAEEATARARGAAQIEGANLLGGKIREALHNASPEMKAASEALQKQLGELGASDIEEALYKQAQDELALGGKLSADQIRNVTQGSRAAYASRGLGRGVPAAVAEVMQRDTASQQRLDARRQFAGGVDAYANNRKASERAFSQSALTTANAVYDPFQRLYGAGGSQVSGLTGGQNIYQPYLNASQAVGAGNQAAAIAAMQEAGQNARFGEQLGYNRWEFGQNLDYARWASGQQSAASTQNGMMSAFGSIAGSLISSYMSSGGGWGSYI